MNTKPLINKTIVVTRAREQAGEMIDQLAELGANVIEFPVIKIVDPLDFGPMDEAIVRLDGFDWVIFTSVNGVDYFWQRLVLAGKDATAFAGRKVCAIGPATAQELRDHGVSPDLVPHKFVAEGILADLGDVKGLRFLLPRAELAREALLEGLEARGATVEQVVAYRTVVAPDRLGPDDLSATELVAKLQTGQVELITFTSSSTVNNFAARLATATATPFPELLARSVVACIGPITAGTARERGLMVGLEAPEFTIDGLLRAIVEYFEPAPAHA